MDDFLIKPEGPYRRLRAPCQKCGDDRGRLDTRNGQDCLFCVGCGKWQYNAPKTETGREPRTLQSIRNIPASQRSRILERACLRCEVCGRTETLTIGHFLSVKDGFDFLTDAELNDDENLIALCAECNAGQGHRTGSLRLLAAILRARVTNLGRKP
jgi:5-methylcytosine-specific restriction endonuclease McrA